MRKSILFVFVFISICSFGQTAVSSINAGSVSQNDLAYSVGEVFVLPSSNPDEANSGLMGILSYIEFWVTDIDDKIVSDDMRIYPNPSSQSVFFEVSSSSPISEIFIYDASGRLLSTRPLATNNSMNVSDYPMDFTFLK